MIRIPNWVVVLLLICMAGLTTSSADAVARAAARRGASKGLEGTINTVGSSGFTFSMKDGKIMKVICDANTKFVAGDAASVKEGARVGIIGNLQAPDEIHATEVKFLGQGKSKKSGSK